MSGKQPDPPEQDKPKVTEAEATERPQAATALAEDTSEKPWLPSPPHVVRFEDTEAVAEAAAKRFLEAAKHAVDKHDRFLVVLAGGSTPKRLYELLAEPPYRDDVPWDKTYFVFSDERCVPPDHEDSNFRMIQETLLDPLEVVPHQVLRMKGEQAPADAARRYEVRLNDLFLYEPKRHFDLVLLGIGADGHTASLFPGTEALEEDKRWVVANHVPRLDAWRLTLTFPALNSARRVLFLATGPSKAQVVAEAFGGVEHSPPHPCERVAPLHARREVLIDQESASAMGSGGRRKSSR